MTVFYWCPKNFIHLQTTISVNKNSTGNTPIQSDHQYNLLKNKICNIVVEINSLNMNKQSFIAICIG